MVDPLTQRIRSFGVSVPKKPKTKISIPAPVVQGVRGTSSKKPKKKGVAPPVETQEVTEEEFVGPVYQERPRVGLGAPSQVEQMGKVVRLAEEKQKAPTYTSISNQLTRAQYNAKRYLNFYNQRRNVPGLARFEYGPDPDVHEQISAARVVRDVPKEKKKLKELGDQGYKIKRTRTGDIQFYKTKQQLARERYDYFVKQREQGIAGKVKAASAATIWGAFNPDFWYESITKGPRGGQQVVADAMFRVDPLVQSGDWLGYGKEIVLSPGVTNVILPLATGYTLGAGIGALKTAAPVIGKTAEIALVGYGGYETSKKVLSSKNLGKDLFRIGFTLPSAIGGYGAGMKAGATATSSFMTSRGISPMTYGSTFYTRINPVNVLRNQWVKWGAKKVKPEDVFDPNVLSSKTVFAQSPSARTSLQMFRGMRDPATGEYLTVHAAPSRFSRVGTIGKGSSESPGLYVTPYGKGSPYFLKTTPPSTIPQYTKFTLFPRVSKAGVLKFRLSNVIRAPRTVRYSTKAFNRYIMGRKPGDTAVITAKHEMGSPEIEALIRFDTPYQMQTGSSFLSRVKGYSSYTSFKGRNIPIYDVSIPKTGGLGGLSKFTPKIAERYSMDSLYSGVSTRSYIGPTSISLSSTLSSLTKYSPSYTPSSSVYSYHQPSYNVPSIPSYKPPSSGKPSMPSYKPPSYIPPSSPTYKPPSYSPPSYPTYKPPSYTPPITPTYKPPYKPPPSDDTFYMKKIAKKYEPIQLRKGYRERTWKVPTLKQLLGV